MNWKSGFFDKIGDFLRFIGYACLAVDVIVLALFSLWFTSKFVWFFIGWLDRVMFAHKW
jgi:hypothetical protein